MTIEEQRRYHISHLSVMHKIPIVDRAFVLKQIERGCCPMETAFAVTHYKTGYMPCFSDVTKRYVFMNDCDLGEEVPYFICLHEFGHIVKAKDSPMWKKWVSGETMQPEDELQSEEQAWEWAISQALEVTPLMREKMHWALKSYRDYIAVMRKQLDRKVYENTVSTLERGSCSVPVVENSIGEGSVPASKNGES